jgi:hypothetical protein
VWGAIFSASAEVSDTITIAKAFEINSDSEWWFDAEVVATLSDKLTLTVGGGTSYTTDFHASAQLDWAPGGGFTAYKGVKLEDDGDIKVFGGGKMAF